MNCISKCFSRKKKKGSVLEVIGIFITLVIFAVSIYVGRSMWEEAKAVPELQTNATAPIIAEADFWFTYLPDNLFLGLYVGLVIAAIASAIISKAHPLFMYVAILSSLFLIVVAVFISNWYEEFAASGEFASFAGAYPIMSFIMGHLPLMTLVTIFLVIVVLYMTRSGGGAREF